MNPDSQRDMEKDIDHNKELYEAFAVEPDELEVEEIEKTSEPIKVEWQGGLGNEQTVKVDPYTAKITVNEREFDIGTLCSDDIPDWIFQTVDR